MKRVIDIDKEYNMKGKAAINRFFKTHPDLEYWKETFEWMLENGVDFFADTMMADGTKNEDWCYALHLDVEEQIGNYTYIAIIERA